MPRGRGAPKARGKGSRGFAPAGHAAESNLMLHTEDAPALALPCPPAATHWASWIPAYVIATYEGTLIAVNTEGHRVAQMEDTHANGLLCMSVCERRQLLITSGEDGAVRVWRCITRAAADAAAEQGLPMEFRLVAEAIITKSDVPTAMTSGRGRVCVPRVAANASGSLLAAAAGRAVLLIPMPADVTDAAAAGTGKRTLVPSTFAEVDQAVDDVVFTSADKLIACVNGGIHVYARRAIAEHEAGPSVRPDTARRSTDSVTYAYKCWPMRGFPSPDGRWLAASCHDQSVHLWILESGQDMECSGYVAIPWGVSWSGSGQYMASTGDRTITVWDTRGPDGTPAGTMPVVCMPPKPCLSTAVAFQPDTSCILAGFEDGQVLLFDVSKAQTTTRGRPRFAPHTTSWHVSTVPGADRNIVACVWGGDAHALIVTPTHAQVLSLLTTEDE